MKTIGIVPQKVLKNIKRAAADVHAFLDLGENKVTILNNLVKKRRANAKGYPKLRTCFPLIDRNKMVLY